MLGGGGGTIESLSVSTAYKAISQSSSGRSRFGNDKSSYNSRQNVAFAVTQSQLDSTVSYCLFGGTGNIMCLKTPK